MKMQPADIWRLHPVIVHVRTCRDCQRLNPCNVLALYAAGVMKALVLVLLLAAPVAAQDGPIARSVAKQYARPDATTTTYSTQMRSPWMFWSGVALVGAGTFVTVAGVVWEQESDLSHEDPNVRLGRDLAPCGATRTALPIADCKTNEGLLWLGAGMAVGGGLLMLVGGQTVQVVEVTPHSLAMRIRF